MKFLSAWKGPTKERHNVRHALRAHIRIASWTAKSHQETNMTSNAVANYAKARQVNEKPLLKDGGKRIVEIGSLCESPQFLSDLGSFRRKAKEVGKHTESLLYAILKVR